MSKASTPALSNRVPGRMGTLKGRPKIKPSGIRILAVMNLKRRPMYWVGRE